jgi:hypothetical protein
MRPFLNPLLMSPTGSEMGSRSGTTQKALDSTSGYRLHDDSVRCPDLQRFEGISVLEAGPDLQLQLEQISRRA